MAESWVCGSCRSVNSSRAGRCYSCHAPREAVGRRPDELSTVVTPLPARALRPYRSSWLRAGLASIGVIMTGTLGALLFWLVMYPTLAGISRGDDAGATRVFDEGRGLLLAFVATGGVTLILWSAWISRVVDNLPAVGAGWPRVGPQMAFFELFIPGRNFYTLPARVRDVLILLDPAGRGQLLVGATWVAMFVPWFLGALVFNILVRTIGHRREVVGIFDNVFAFASLMTSVGIVLAVVLIARVESLEAWRAQTVADHAKAPAPGAPPSGRQDGD